MAKLTVNEAGTSGYTHVISLSFSDLNDIKTGTNPFTGESLGTATQLPIATIPAGGAVELAGVFESTALAGATDIVLDVGTTGGDQMSSLMPLMSMECLLQYLILEMVSLATNHKQFLTKQQLLFLLKWVEQLPT